MKKSIFLALLLTLSLTACQKESNDTKEEINVGSEKVETVGLGDSCEEKKCGDGFECNEEKICVETVVVKDLFCPEMHDPVCGKKGNFKNGYLNECEATRHGAEVLYKGFCNKDETAKGNCEARITRIGYCDTLHTGVEFDGKNCVAKTVTACDAEIPFTTLRACEEKCEGFFK